MSSNGYINSNDYQGRYIKLSWLLKSQSVVNNSSAISWELSGSGVGSSAFYPASDFKVVINGITVYSSSSTIDLYNGTIVSGADYSITHNSDGNKTLQIEIEANINGSIVRGSNYWELTPINRNAVITSCDNFTDIEDPRVSFLNPNNSTVRIDLKCNNVLIASRTETAPRSPYTIALTSAERDLLRDQTPNSNNIEVIYQIETLIGGEAVYIDQATAYMRIVEADPIISGVTYRDNNADTITITGNDQEIIENKSLLIIEISRLTAIKGSNLSRVDITINGEVVSTMISGSVDANRSISIGFVNSSSDLIAEVKLTDTRGNESKQYITVNMLAWSNPSALIDCKRQGNYYSNTDLTINAVFNSLNNRNTLTIQYEYKESPSGSWSTLVTVDNHSTTTLNLDNTKAFDIRVILTDLLGSTTYNLSVDIGSPIFFIDKDKRSVGVNCLPQDNKSLEVNGRNVLSEIDLKQNITDNNLQTTDKTIVGAINELLGSAVNVQADWSESDPNAPDYIKNKPTIPTKTSDLTNDSNFVSDSNYVHTDNNFTNADVTKLSSIEAGAEVNVQADWTQTDTTADDYIKNKPTVATIDDTQTSSSEAWSSQKTDSELNLKVNKAGDTTTGAIIRSTTIDPSTAPSGTKTFNVVEMANANNEQMLRVETYQTSANTIVTQWCQTRKVSGSNILNYFNLGIKSDGSKTVGISEPALWRSALSLATVASSGSYNDLSNKPTIPTVNNGTLTIQKNGSNVATFTANSSSNVTANISVPKVVGGTIIITFNGSGYRDVALSAFSGLTSKPDSMILSAQSSQNCFIEYNWDSSSNTTLRIHGHGVNNNNTLINLNGNVRIGWIAIDK